MSRVALVLALLASWVAAGCGTADDRDQARAAVERFYAAIGEDDGEGACDELGESLVEEVESQTGRSCPEAITGFEYEGGSVASTEVYVTNAKVDLGSGESAFLGREADGWKLSAIGCKAEDGKPGDRPFDCEVES